MTIFDEIAEWNKKRNNVEFNAANEYKMIQEELIEFLEGNILKNNSDMADALCDIIVVATGALWKLGYNPNKAMEETLKEISSRKQDLIQEEEWSLMGKAIGKWKKWAEQPKETLYKADYSKCLRSSD